MRRNTPNCSPVVREQRRLAAELERYDLPAVVEALEPLVTPERRARLRRAFEARLDAVTLVMDAPHDPHNGAAILRSADAFGLHRIHVVERREGFLAANSVARGSERWVDVVPHGDDASAIAALRASGHTLVATHPQGELQPAALRDLPRVALVLGNERNGIADALREACATSVRIPMRGLAESLNVSVTAAILLAAAVADRPGDLPEGQRLRLYARALVLTLPHAPEVLAARHVEARGG